MCWCRNEQADARGGGCGKGVLCVKTDGAEGEMSWGWSQVLHDMEGFTFHISHFESQIFMQTFGFYVLKLSLYVANSLHRLCVHLFLMLPTSIQVPMLPLSRKPLQFQERKNFGNTNSCYLCNMIEDVPKSTQAAPKSIKDSRKTPAVITSPWIRS